MSKSAIAVVQSTLQSQQSELRNDISTYKNLVFNMVSAVSKKLGDPSLMTSLEQVDKEEKQLSPSSSAPQELVSMNNILLDKSDSTLNDDLRSICKQALVMIQQMTSWDSKIQAMEKEVQKLKERIDSDEQYSKNYDLLLHNFPNVPTEKSNYEFSKWAVDELNDHLPSLSPKLKWHDIDTSHAFKTHNKSANPMAIVRFCSRDTKRRVLKCKSDLKSVRFQGKATSLTEHLTSKNLNLFKDAQAHYGFKKVWTDNCVILTQGADGKTKRVKRSDIPPRSAPQGNKKSYKASLVNSNNDEPSTSSTN